jgi:hypothetical protein
MIIKAASVVRFACSAKLWSHTMSLSTNMPRSMRMVHWSSEVWAVPARRHLYEGMVWRVQYFDIVGGEEIIPSG